MRTAGLCIVLLCACLSGGCYVASLQGLADETSTVSDDTLVGRWYSVDDDVEVTIAPDEWRTYSVVMRDAAGERKFTARVTTIASRQFFDLTVQNGLESMPALLPVHLIGRFTTKDDALVVELLTYDWFRGRLERGSLTVPAVLDERDTVLVTASRQKLREWLTANATASALFEEAMVLSKNAPASK